MDVFDGLRRTFRDATVSQRVTMGAAIVVVVLAAVAFTSWVTAPSYAVLYSDIDPAQLSTVTQELDANGIAYRLEAGGRVLVPQQSVYQARADLAATGIQGAVVPPGYELLDQQGLSVSDFRQRVDYQRALEGELARTLTAMSSIRSATVHLVIPAEALFAENQEPVTASVLIDPTSTMAQGQVDSITYLVASSVEGLEPGQVTVASTDGTVLQAAGDDTTVAGAGNRQLQATQAFEKALASDLNAMLGTVLGPGRSSVVVRATLDFDERSTESETYAPDSATPLREQIINEAYNGIGNGDGGTVGVDGGEIPPGADASGSYDYSRDEQTTEYGIDRVVVRTTDAPGTIQRLSAAVVVDDGSLTGATPIPVETVRGLVAAAMGIQTERGDTVEVSAVPFPTAAPTEDATPAATDIVGLIPTILAALALVVVAVAFFLMTRRSRKDETVVDTESVRLALEARNQQLAMSAKLASSADEAAMTVDASMQAQVKEMVEQQPEEIAMLLRSWLADRREDERVG